MKYNSRIIFSDNGTPIDYTQDLNDFRSGTVTLDVVAAQDALYIGSILPFNHLFFEIGTANDQTSVLSIKNWWGTSWHDCFDIMDGTKVSGKTFAQSGVIQFSPDNWKGWDRWARNDSNNFELYTLNIFDKYWIKITFSGNLKATTTIKYIGHKFSNDSALYGYYPDLNQSALKTAFASGKTSWDEQHYQAASELIDYLNATNVILTKDQILDSALFEKASIHKTAEIIYQGLGKDYQGHSTRAYNKFKQAMDIKNFRVDKNGDANLTGCEFGKSVGELYR